MKIFITPEPMTEYPGDTVCVTIDGSAKGMWGHHARRMADRYIRIDQALNKLTYPIPLGVSKIIPLSGGFKYVVALSTNGHTKTDKTERATIARSALSSMFQGLGDGGVISCPLLTCGTRVNPETALISMLSLAERNLHKQGEFIIHIPEWRWGALRALCSSLSLEEKQWEN